MSSSDWNRKRGHDGEPKESGDDGKSSDGDEPSGQQGPTSQNSLPPPQHSPSSPEQEQQQGQSSHGPPRYPGARAPDGYYQPVYQPPNDGSAPPHSAYPHPPRGYEGNPYGMHPPMSGYPPHPMYPYQPPMYPPYPGYGPPPPHVNPYGYPPHDPSMAPGGVPPPPPPQQQQQQQQHPQHPQHPPSNRYGEEQGADMAPTPYHHQNTGPVGAPSSASASSVRSDEDDERKLSRPDFSTPENVETERRPETIGDDKDDSSSIVPGAVTARLKTYIKPRVPSTQDVLDRRARKNAQSRARAAKLRDRIIEIEMKPESERDEEERQIWKQYENRRQRKNDRSRERALEKKEEIDRILAKPEKKRTKIEKQFLETALTAKKRKNEGDRLRRQRLKELGLSTKGSGVKISARGPLPTSYGHGGVPQQQPMPQHHGYPPPPHMGDIPMSPMPSMGGHHHHPQYPQYPHHHHPHHHMQSPNAFGSPGMMPNLGFPSPQQPRGPAAAAPGAMETPGRPRADQSGGHLPYIPPPQVYDAHGSPAPQNRMHMQHPSSRVEQRRHPDGSMSISIGGGGDGGGGGGAGGSSFGGETRLPASEEQSTMNISDVSHLLLYSDNGDGEDGDNGDRQEPHLDVKNEEE